MKIVIAPDKFKGSLTGIEFCNSVKRGISKHDNNAEIIKLPLADGGDGTVETIEFYIGGKVVRANVNNPLMQKIQASYLFSSQQKMAFIEMAAASGISLLKTEELNPMQTTTFGTGELIKDAIEKGAKHIILGIGGSATNDAGLGMARALGFRFFDINGNELKGRGCDLLKLHSIDRKNVLEELKDIRFEVACDVDNQLFGEKGAAYIYSPQKGASPKVVQELDKGLRNFNTIVHHQYDIDLQNKSGAGAAGGLGAGCILFLNAELKAGTKLIKDLANFDERVKDADWIITGEGKFDEQTFSGKVIKGILESRHNQKLAVFCGLSDLTKKQLQSHKIDYLAEIISYARGFEDSMKNSGIYLEKLAMEFAKKYLKPGN